MTNQFDNINHALDTQVNTETVATVRPSGGRTPPLSRAVRANGAQHRDMHYDWMDFHSIPELSLQW